MGKFITFIGLCVFSIVAVLAKLAFICFVAGSFVLCAIAFKESDSMLGFWGMFVLAFLVGGPLGILVLLFVGKS